jgi:hypothetical protein
MNDCQVAASPVVRKAQRTRGDYTCAERFHPFLQCAVGGDDDVVAGALALEELDDGVVAFACGGDDPYPGNGFHAARDALDDEDELGVIAGARNGSRPGGRERVTQLLGGTDTVAPPAIRHRSDHVRGVHDCQHALVVPERTRNIGCAGRGVRLAKVAPYAALCLAAWRAGYVVGPAFVCASTWYTRRPTESSVPAPALQPSKLFRLLAGRPDRGKVGCLRRAGWQ